MKTKHYEWRYDTNKTNIHFGLFNKHYFIIKDVSAPKQCYEFAVENLVWTEKLTLGLETVQ